MRVLLVSANTEQINMPVSPLGLACVAAFIQEKGHDVKVVNLMMQKDTRIVIKEAITVFNPQVIGISVRNIDDQKLGSAHLLLDPVKEVVADCRDFSDVPIVLGGAGYSIFPQSTLEYLGADMGIQGEGEISFSKLLEHLENNEEPSGVPGLYLPNKGLQKETEYSKNLNKFPMPLPGIHMVSHSDPRDSEIWIPFQTRRGCPLNCSYCSTATIEGRIIRKHEPEHVIDALSRYVDSGFKRFFFVDNIFNLPPSYAKKLCDKLTSSGLNITWKCILYPWKVDEELVEKMARAGCQEVSLGFESGSKKILQKMNKKYTPEQVRQISALLKKYGINQLGFLLLGGPGETKKTILESLSFADSLNLEAMKVTKGIRIYPYTDLAKTSIKEGLIKNEGELLFPTFYTAKGLEDWLEQTIDEWMETRPNWIL